MAVFQAKKVENSLRKKGVSVNDTHHHFFEFWHNGKFILKTKTSHNGQDIDDYLIRQMYAQCKLSKEQFLDLINCPLSKEQYINILAKNNCL
jgi:hypothetical protein